MTPETPRDGKGLERADLLVLLSLLAILGAEVLAWRAGHRSEEELWRVYRTEASQARIQALHVLTNRDRPHGFDQNFVRQMLRSPQALIREFSMTYDLSRLGGNRAQQRYLHSSLPDRDEVFRCRFFLRHQNSRFSRAQLRRYVEALRAASRSGR